MKETEFLSKKNQKKKAVERSELDEIYTENARLREEMLDAFKELDQSHRELEGLNNEYIKFQKRQELKLSKQFKIILNLTDKIESNIANSNSSEFSLDAVLPEGKSVSKIEIKAISEILKKYPQIKSFSSSEYNVSKVLPEIVYLLKQNPNITECILVSANISKKHIDDVKSLMTSTGVKFLDLSLSKLTLIVPEMLKSLHKLELIGAGLITKSLRVFSNLEIQSSLQKLYLDNNDIGNVGLRHIATAINNGKFPDIANIFLNNNNISKINDLVKALAEGNTSIVKLSLTNNKITLKEFTKKGYEALQMLFQKPSFHVLDLSGNIIKDEQAVKLLESLGLNDINVNIHNNPTNDMVIQECLLTLGRNGSEEIHHGYFDGNVDYYSDDSDVVVSGDNSFAETGLNISTES